MQILKETLEKFAPFTYKTSALVWDGSYADLCPVDYYALYTPDWVVFPWENIPHTLVILNKDYISVFLIYSIR